MQAFIEGLQFPLLVIYHSKISVLLCPENFISNWHCAKDEKTSSSPSSLHFGHFKAVVGLDFPDLAYLHARFTQLVFMMGFSP